MSITVSLTVKALSTPQVADVETPWVLRKPLSIHTDEKVVEFENISLNYVELEIFEVFLSIEAHTLMPWVALRKPLSIDAHIRMKNG